MIFLHGVNSRLWFGVFHEGGTLGKGEEERSNPTKDEVPRLIILVLYLEGIVQATQSGIHLALCLRQQQQY